MTLVVLAGISGKAAVLKLSAAGNPLTIAETLSIFYLYNIDIPGIRPYFHYTLQGYCIRK